MKRFAVFLSMIAVLSLIIAGAAAADVSKDERNLDREVKRLNDTAAKPDGEKAVVKQLAIDLNTTDQRIRSLRDQRLGYGEIACLLSLAQNLPGGVTDANVQKVLALRQGPPVRGWGEVARQLGVKLGKTVSQVRKTANNANREIKNDHARSGRAPKEAPVEQKTEQQPQAKKEYRGEGRMLRQGISAK